MISSPKAAKPAAEGASSAVRRFACTSCGRCCTHGPEMALSEATELAGTFITTMSVRVYSLPLAKNAKGVAHWSAYQGSSLPPAAALEEQRRHIERFAARTDIDKSRGRSLHLVMSALTLDTRPGRCPALSGALCGIYEARPLTCRTVPMHYSRPFSVLAGNLDAFVRIPGHRCDTSAGAPVVLDDQGIADASLRQLREDAINLAASERRWKDEIVAAMQRPEVALAAGLPTYALVLQNSDAGSVTSAPMLAAWRVAKQAGLLSRQAFLDVCRRQAGMIEAELTRGAGAHTAMLVGMLSDFEAELRSPVLPSIPHS